MSEMKNNLRKDKEESGLGIVKERAKNATKAQ